jgi:hypothetical protein
MTDQSIETTACHEAGHAVAAYRLIPSMYDGGVSIVPNKELGTLGQSRDEDRSWVADVEEQRKVVLILLAGYAACVASGMEEEAARLGCDNDFEEANHIIALWDLEPLDTQLRAAVTLMSKDQNRTAIGIVVSELLERQLLIEGEVELLVDLADGEITEGDLAQWRLHARAEDTRRLRLQFATKQ